MSSLLNPGCVALAVTGAGTDWWGWLWLTAQLSSAVQPLEDALMMPP